MKPKKCSECRVGTMKAGLTKNQYFHPMVIWHCNYCRSYKEEPYVEN